MQPKPHVYNYRNGAKTVAYYANESFTPSTKNQTVLVGDRGTVFDSVNCVIIPPGDPIPSESEQYTLAFDRISSMAHQGLPFTSIAKAFGIQATTTTNGNSTETRFQIGSRIKVQQSVSPFYRSLTIDFSVPKD